MKKLLPIINAMRSFRRVDHSLQVQTLDVIIHGTQQFEGVKKFTDQEKAALYKNKEYSLFIEHLAQIEANAFFTLLIESECAYDFLWEAGSEAMACYLRQLARVPHARAFELLNENNWFMSILDKYSTDKELSANQQARALLLDIFLQFPKDQQRTLLAQRQSNSPYCSAFLLLIRFPNQSSQLEDEQTVKRIFDYIDSLENEEIRQLLFQDYLFICSNVSTPFYQKRASELARICAIDRYGCRDPLAPPVTLNDPWTLLVSVANFHTHSQANLSHFLKIILRLPILLPNQHWLSSRVFTADDYPLIGDRYWHKRQQFLQVAARYQPVETLVWLLVDSKLPLYSEESVLLKAFKPRAREIAAYLLKSEDPIRQKELLAQAVNIITPLGKILQQTHKRFINQKRQEFYMAKISSRLEQLYQIEERAAQPKMVSPALSSLGKRVQPSAPPADQVVNKPAETEEALPAAPGKEHATVPSAPTEGYVDLPPHYEDSLAENAEDEQEGKTAEPTPALLI